MTQEYSIQWPWNSGIDVFDADLPRKWCHSVIAERDFCSEWSAGHRATELALQLGCTTFHPPNLQHVHKRQRVGKAQVSFCSNVDVFIGDFNSIEMHHVTVPAEVLAVCDKPWSNRRTRHAAPVPIVQFDFEADVNCSIDLMFAPFLPGCGPYEFHASTDSSLSALHDPFSCQDALAPVVQSVDSTDLHHRTPLNPNEGPFFDPLAHFGASGRRSLHTRTAKVHCPEVCCDPLSIEAVLIPDAQQKIVNSHLADGSPEISSVGDGCVRGDDCQYPEPTWCAPVTHPDAGSAGSASASATAVATGVAQPPVGVAPPALQVPDFALGILTDLPLEYQSNPVRIVRGILVRTWLLHHVNFPRSLQPRQCMITGPPHTWRAQILAVWFGTTIPQEDVSIDLVKPHPPRNWHETSILFDVVLAQGLQSGRVAGLVTVSPTFQHAVVRMYSVAVSFLPMISGQDLVTSADIQDLCNLYDCLVFHDHLHLPIDFHRHFHVPSGASFVVLVSNENNADPLTENLPVENRDLVPESEQMELDSGHAVALDTHRTHGLVPSSVAEVESRRRIMVHFLDAPPTSIWVRLNRHDVLIQEVLAQVLVDPYEFVALHRVLAKPIGEAHDVTSFILQRHRDMPPGSSDQLLLLDVVFHQHGSAVAPLFPQGFDRRVIRVPVQASRSGLLSLARVAHYCASRVDCIVQVFVGLHCPSSHVICRMVRMVAFMSHLPKQLAWKLAELFPLLNLFVMLRPQRSSRSILVCQHTSSATAVRCIQMTLCRKMQQWMDSSLPQ